MTNFNPENLTSAARGIALTAEEKAASRARLVSYMELTPSRAAAKAVRAPRFAGFSFLHLSRAAGVFSLVGAVLLSGAGVSYAAENALPGDVLYPVKVDVNEEVRAALTQDEEKKADWEAERAERRLAETEALAETGRLDDSRRAEMEARYAKHAARAQERMTKLRAMKEDGPGRADEVEARLEGAVDAHAKIIAAIAEGHPGAEVRGIAAPVMEKTDAEEDEKNEESEVEKPKVEEDKNDDSAEGSRVRRNQESDTQDVAKKTEKSAVRVPQPQDMKRTTPERGDSAAAADASVTAGKSVSEGLATAAQARRTTAVRMIAENRAILAEVSAKLDADAVTEAEARLKAADAAIAEGDALLAAGDAKGAAAKFVAAQRSAQESRLLFKARANLRVKVKLNMEEKQSSLLRDARRTERR